MLVEWRLCSMSKIKYLNSYVLSWWRMILCFVFCNYTFIPNIRNIWNKYNVFSFGVQYIASCWECNINLLRFVNILTQRSNNLINNHQLPTNVQLNWSSYVLHACSEFAITDRPTILKANIHSILPFSSIYDHVYLCIYIYMKHWT